MKTPKFVLLKGNQSKLSSLFFKHYYLKMERRDRLTWHLAVLVIHICFGTWLPMGFSLTVVNGPQKEYIKWIRIVQCGREQGNGNDNSTWCTPLEDTSLALSGNRVLSTIWALITSIVAAGAVVGSLFTDLLIEKIGLKRSFYCYGLVMSMGVGLSCVAPSAHSYELLIVARFIIGLAIGISTIITPMYTTEITTAGTRGKLGTLPIISFVTGLILSGAFSMPGKFVLLS